MFLAFYPASYVVLQLRWLRTSDVDLNGRRGGTDVPPYSVVKDVDGNALLVAVPTSGKSGRLKRDLL